MTYECNGCSGGCEGGQGAYSTGASNPMSNSYDMGQNPQANNYNTGNPEEEEEY